MWASPRKTPANVEGAGLLPFLSRVLAKIFSHTKNPKKQGKGGAELKAHEA